MEHNHGRLLPNRSSRRPSLCSSRFAAGGSNGVRRGSNTMGVKTALVLLVPSAAYGFWVPPSQAIRSTQNRSSNNNNSNGVNRRSSGELPSRETLASAAAAAPDSGLRRRARRELVVAAGAGEPDTHASATGANPRRRVSRALNRALGNIVATGDMFGSVSKSVSDENSFGRHFSSSIEHEDDERQVDEEEDDYLDDDDDDQEGGGDEAQHDEDVEDLFAGGNRLSLRKFGQKRRSSSANRLLRANTEASAAVVVDGPFDKLQAYMTLPVSEYSLLDSSIIRRVSEASFRFQIPLKDFVGLDFTPTMEVEVEPDPQTKAVVFRSVRSTLYGNVGKPGEEASTNPWPEAASSKVEYFQVAFDARLRWVDGDASRAPRQRGRGGFGGEFVRRPRPAPPREASPAAGAGPGPTAAGSGGTASAEGAVGGIGGGGSGVGVDPGGVLASMARGEVGGRGEASDEAEEGAGPATVFCDTEIKVQVLLPPPYNTLLPWRLVRVLLGKLLSTIVAYVLPRFLELLADDFYGWQSGSRRSAATAGETSRTLLGAKGGGSGGWSTGRGWSSSVVGAQQANRARAEGAVAAAGGQEGGSASRRGGGSAAVGNGQSSNDTNNRNPVVGGFQRLRNVRGSAGERVEGRARAAAAGEVAAATTPSPAATLQQPIPSAAAASNRGSGPEGDRLQDWAAPSAPSGGGVSGDGFNFEVNVEEYEEEKGDDERRQQRWRRGWRGGGDRGVEGGGGGGGGGGGPINWWG